MKKKILIFSMLTLFIFLSNGLFAKNIFKQTSNTVKTIFKNIFQSSDFDKLNKYVFVQNKLFGATYKGIGQKTNKEYLLSIVEYGKESPRYIKEGYFTGILSTDEKIYALYFMPKGNNAFSAFLIEFSNEQKMIDVPIESERIATLILTPEWKLSFIPQTDNKLLKESIDFDKYVKSTLITNPKTGTYKLNNNHPNDYISINKVNAQDDESLYNAMLNASSLSMFSDGEAVKVTQPLTGFFTFRGSNAGRYTDKRSLTISYVAFFIATKDSSHCNFNVFAIDVQKGEKMKFLDISNGEKSASFELR